MSQTKNNATLDQVSLHAAPLLKELQEIGTLLSDNGVPSFEDLCKAGVIDKDASPQYSELWRLQFMLSELQRDAFRARSTATTYTQPLQPPMTFDVSAHKTAKGGYTYDPEVKNAPDVDTAVEKLREMIMKADKMLAELTSIPASAPF